MESNSHKSEVYVNEKEAARTLGMSVDWLRKQRRLNQGPPWVKFGRAVRYCGISCWAAQQEVSK